MSRRGYKAYLYHESSADVPARTRKRQRAAERAEIEEDVPSKSITPTIVPSIPIPVTSPEDEILDLPSVSTDSSTAPGEAHALQPHDETSEKSSGLDSHSPLLERDDDSYEVTSEDGRSAVDLDSSDSSGEDHRTHSTKDTQCDTDIDWTFMRPAASNEAAHHGDDSQIEDSSQEEIDLFVKERDDGSYEVTSEDGRSAVDLDSSDSSGEDHRTHSTKDTQCDTDIDWTFMRPAASNEAAHHGDDSQNEDSSQEENDLYVKVVQDLNLNGSSDVFSGARHRFTTSDLIKILLILATKLRHNLTYSAAEDIVKLGGVLYDSEPIPRSTKYFWKKAVHAFSKGVSYHHVCPKCFHYLGVAQQSCATDFYVLQCPCGEVVNVKDNVKSGNVFIYSSLMQQLKVILEVCKEPCNHKLTRKKENSFAFEDIYDGEIYKLVVEADMLSVNFSVDGVPCFKSSNFSFTPLVCTLNDLEPRKRSDYLMLCGLWCGEGKPKNMNAFLTPFVAESRLLGDQGFTFNINGVEHIKRVRILVGISDSVQRPVLRCSTQFNGEYGCDFCLHPGIVVPRGRGDTRVYPLKNLEGDVIPIIRRTHENTLDHARDQMFGIKGLSILCDVPRFNIVLGLDLDWPHAVLFGVARQFSKLWFEPQNHTRPFSLSSKIKSIDKFLLSIKPSCDVSRTPRKVSARKFWKMHEWAMWLYFYSLPTLKQFSDRNEYVRHWAYLVEGISILSKRSILRSEIAYAENCLQSFIQDIPTLYGVEHVSFNVHLLCHLPQSVLNYSCLWTHSSFIYEDCYQDLLQFVQSSQGVYIQVCDSFRMRWVVKQLLSICKGKLKETEATYLESILSRKLRSSPSESVPGGFTLGSGTPTSLDGSEFHALLRREVNIQRGTPVNCYHRALVNGEVIHSKGYSKVNKRNSYVVLVENEQIFEIDSFLVFDENSIRKCYALGFYFDLKKKTTHERF